MKWGTATPSHRTRASLPAGLPVLQLCTSGTLVGSWGAGCSVRRPVPRCGLARQALRGVRGAGGEDVVADAVDETGGVGALDGVLGVEGGQGTAVGGLGAGGQRAGQLGEAPEAGVVVDEEAEERLVEVVLGGAGRGGRVRLRMHRNDPSCAGARAGAPAPGPICW